MTFRARTFLSIFVATALALGVSMTLTSLELRRTMQNDLREGLKREARLASALLAGRHDIANPDAEADTLGQLISARVTFIAADGRVLGDSEVAADALDRLENHASREEVLTAARMGEGVGRRVSATTGLETEYVAEAVRDSDVAFVRLALPLTTIAARLGAVRRWAVVGLAAGLAAALVLTWGAAMLLSRRVDAIAQVARRYRAGDFSQPLRDHGHDEIGTVAGVLDETARELGLQLREMARERAHRDAILTGMVEGIVLVNSAGRLVLVNPAVRAMLRLSDTPEGRHYLEVVRHPDIASQLASALNGASPPVAEVQLEPGGRRTFMAHVVPVTRERGGGAVLVLHDVTDLRRADQIRRDFVANVSHELRTPLTAIRGYVEALLDAPVDAEESRRFLEVIARHAMNMERLVRDLLRLARLDAGQETIERRPVPVSALVGSVERDLKPLLDARRQRIATAIGDDVVADGDRMKLQDILRNLIENASNYGPEGGAIDIGAHVRDGVVEISVGDRGPGIPEADLTRIFERFYRVDRSRTRDPGGTGLGLSIVRHLVELHDGRVSAANRQGGGAIVVVEISAIRT